MINITLNDRISQSGEYEFIHLNCLKDKIPEFEENELFLHRFVAIYNLCVFCELPSNTIIFNQRELIEKHNKKTYKYPKAIMNLSRHGKMIYERTYKKPIEEISLLELTKNDCCLDL